MCATGNLIKYALIYYKPLKILKIVFLLAYLKRRSHGYHTSFHTALDICAIHDSSINDLYLRLHVTDM